MTFVLAMVWRELRATWHRLLFFFLCVAIGVGGIVAIRSLVQNVRSALASEARSLTAGDVYLRSDQPWSQEARGAIASRLDGIPDLAVTETVDTVTMARVAPGSNGRAKVVEVRAVQSAFPLYGRFVLESGKEYSSMLLDERGALVGSEVLTQLGISVGDAIAIGTIEFQIRDVIVTEPGRQLGGFSFGPRVIIAYDALEQTGLLDFASRAERQILLKVPEASIGSLVDSLRDDLGEMFVSVGSYRRTENRIERHLGRAEDYLSLIGFVVLIIGGIGVWSVTRVFVQQRLRSVAVMKCLGATTGRVLSVYVVQVGLLGFSGSLLGVGLAQVGLMSLPDSLASQAAEATGFAVVSATVTGAAIAQGLVIGVLISILFALIPLVDIRNVKPIMLLRSGETLQASPFDSFRVALGGAIAVLLVVVASWQADSFEVGAYVVGGFVSVAAVLHVLSRILVQSLRPLEGAKWFPLRHAVLNLRRSGNQTRVVLLAVGLGSFFIVGTRAVQENLVTAFSLELRDDMPDMFMMDIQQGQVDGVRAILRETALGPNGNAPVPQLLPVLRARVVSVAGPESDIQGREAIRKAGLGREYTVTYRERLAENERVVDGRFWDDTATQGPEVSIVDDLVERGIRLGDSVTVNVLGRQIVAPVTSVRTVDWDDSRAGGFMFVFSPGSFDGAPHSYISFLQGPALPEERGLFQSTVVSQFPNVSVIDGIEVIRDIRRVLEYVAVAITAVGSIAMIVGILILVGSVAMTKFQRLYESAVLKTLGAKSSGLAVMYVFEYGLLGLIAGTVGSGGSLILTWLLTRQVLEIAWTPAPLTTAMGVALTATLVLTVGVVSSLDVLRQKPLLTLRAE